MTELSRNDLFTFSDIKLDSFADSLIQEFNNIILLHDGKQVKASERDRLLRPSIDKVLSKQEISHESIPISSSTSLQTSPAVRPDLEPPSFLHNSNGQVHDEKYRKAAKGLFRRSMTKFREIYKKTTKRKRNSVQSNEDFFYEIEMESTTIWMSFPKHAKTDDATLPTDCNFVDFTARSDDLRLQLIPIINPKKDIKPLKYNEVTIASAKSSI